jgi:putative endonuclease
VAGYLYILASRRHGTIYIGSTTDLPKRIYEHRHGLVVGFTRENDVKRLVHVETSSRHQRRHRQGTAHEGMAARLEDTPDLEGESVLG